MGVQQSTGLNSDADGKFTSSEYGDSGDTVSRWYQWRRTADGGDVTQGATTDAAVTNPASAMTVMAALKGIITHLATLITSNSAIQTQTTTVATRLNTAAAAGILKAEDAAHASGDLGVAVWNVRNDARTAYGATNDYTPNACGAGGESFVANVPENNTAWALSSSDSTALEASRVIKASAGKLYKLRVTSTAVAPQYVQIFNSATVPADATVPIVVGIVPAGGVLELDFTIYGKLFATGISVSNSSTPDTKTIGSADCLFGAQYL